MAGLAHWSPGGGRWATGGRIALNLVVNLSILGVFGTFTALGEELGWRGYLQPRLDAAGVRNSVAVVGVAMDCFPHADHGRSRLRRRGRPLEEHRPALALNLALAFLWAYGSYRSGSLWTAVFSIASTTRFRSGCSRSFLRVATTSSGLEREGFSLSPVMSLSASRSTCGCVCAGTRGRRSPGARSRRLRTRPEGDRNIRPDCRRTRSREEGRDEQRHAGDGDDQDFAQLVCRGNSNATARGRFRRTILFS